jgi:hypothetical protein
VDVFWQMINHLFVNSNETKMLTKEYISELKLRGNGDIKSLVNKRDDDKSIIYT